MKWYATGVLALVGIAGACADSTTAPTVRDLGRASATISGPVDPGTQTCPTTDGWTKIDAGSGSASGAWGSLSYPAGLTVTVSVLAGFTLELCIKSGSTAGIGVWTIVGPEVGGTITIEQNAISHTAWRVTGGPTNELVGLSVSKSATATYKRTVTWTLDKTVNDKKEESFSGNLGDSFGPVDWEVVANKSEQESDYAVTGQITITNPNPVSVGVSVSDVLRAAGVDLADVVSVDCDAGTAGAQSTGTVPAEDAGADGTLVCNYTSSPSGRTADLNRADVTVDPESYELPDTYSGSIEGGFATAAISWTETLVGDDQTDLTDPRFTFEETISDDDTENFPESFSCPTDRSLYTNRTYSFEETNTAYLDGPNTDLESSATVKVTCRDPFVGESATGKGFKWSATRNAPSTWFMYTPWVTTGVHTGIYLGPADLIAGQFFDVGNITGTIDGTQRKITITLENNALFNAGIVNNVKIYPMVCGTNQQYKQPGQFTIKTSAVPGANSITVNVGNADCYGIHVDVLRYDP